MKVNHKVFKIAQLIFCINNQRQDMQFMFRISLNKFQMILLQTFNYAKDSKPSFSALNRILNKSRNRLLQKNMQNFVLLAMNKQLLKTLDVNILYEKWMKQIKRRGLNVSTLQY